MQSPMGIVNVWAQGDWVIRTVALVLLLMSVVSWTVILVKGLKLRRYQRQASRHTSFWHGRDFDDGLQQLGADTHNPFADLALQGHNATQHILRAATGAKTELSDALDPSEWITSSLRYAIDDFKARAQSGLSVLASIGSTAPFVGLFGTVWGIYHALQSIGSADQASIDLVAGPIGEALIMTAFGLVVAIPAVLGYNALVRGNKVVLHKLNRFAYDLHAYFVTGARVARPGPHGSSAPREG